MTPPSYTDLHMSWPLVFKEQVAHFETGKEVPGEVT